MKVLIVGGVAGGASAAARLRRLDENCEIVMFEKGPYISFANCGLPYYISRTIAEKAKLLVQTPEKFYGRFHVDVRVWSEVTDIDRENKRVKVLNVKTGESYEESYDKLILSPGAVPVKPAIKGLDLDGVFTLRNVPDVEAIDEWLSKRECSHATVVGGGYIGVEMAENLKLRGLDVTIVEFLDHVINNIDSDMARIVQDEMTSNGVELKLKSGVTAVARENGRLKVTTTAGNFMTDMLIVCVGVAPNSELAQKAGLKLGFKKCICVNDKMQTSDPDIYAVGDATEAVNFVTGQACSIALAGPANRQGRIAADQIAGIDSRYKKSQGTSIIKAFGKAVASTGLTEREVKAQGLSYDKIYLYNNAHAGYYPGKNFITSKIIFELKTGRLLGGQFVGAQGVDKTCDVLATAMRANMTATDLIDLELCYAPPFSSVKSTLNMAGFAIENIITGKVKNFHWEDIDKVRETGTLLDVRRRDEFEKGSVPGFINIPLHELRDRLNELPAGKPVYVHCLSGLRSYVACRILSGHGIDCYNIAGGYYMYTVLTGKIYKEPGACQGNCK